MIVKVTGGLLMKPLTYVSHAVELDASLWKHSCQIRAIQEIYTDQKTHPSFKFSSRSFPTAVRFASVGRQVVLVTSILSLVVATLLFLQAPLRQFGCMQVFALIVTLAQVVEIVLFVNAWRSTLNNKEEAILEYPKFDVVNVG